MGGATHQMKYIERGLWLLKRGVALPIPHVCINPKLIYKAWGGWCHPPHEVHRKGALAFKKGGGWCHPTHALNKEGSLALNIDFLLNKLDFVLQDINISWNFLNFLDKFWMFLNSIESPWTNIRCFFKHLWFVCKYLELLLKDFILSWTHIDFLEQY